jgi:hypothetical protein
MHAPLAKYSMMRRLMSSAAWWLSQSAIDIDFRNNRAHDGIPVDPLRASTVLMLHGDGADASTNISDSTGRNFVPPIADVQIDTSQSKFGGSSILFDGTLDRLQVDSADVTFGTGDLTVDFWFRTTTVASQINLFGTYEVGSDYFAVFVAAGGALNFFNGATVITGTTTIAINTWYHVAVTRSGNDHRLFLNGAQEGATYTASKNYATTRFYIGDWNGSGLNGWLDEFRVLKGVAAWTTTFTPPTMPYNVGVGPYDLLSCSRASIGYVQTAVGTLTQFAANQLRITDQGLLIEDARTNSALSSEDFSNATYWTLSSLTVGATIAAPDTAKNGQKIIPGAASSEHFFYYSSASGASPRALSIHAKNAGYNHVGLSLFDGTNYQTIVFELTTGTVTASSGANIAALTSEALASGWWRLSVTMATSSPAYLLFSVCATGTPSFSGTLNLPVSTGNGTDGVYLFGAQTETGAFASSYIPTTSSAATRAADVITTIGALFSLAASSPASFVSDVKTLVAPFGAYWSVLSNVALGRFALVSNGGSDLYVGHFDNGAASLLVATIGNSKTWSIGFKGGVSWNEATPGRSVVGGGGTVSSDSSVNGLAIPDAKLGFANNSVPIFGYFRRLTGWTTKLADADLQALTSPTGPSPTDYAVDLNFLTGAYTVNARPQFYLTCSRASIGYAQTVAGTLTQFAANQLRITDQGLLVEDARTNVLVYSQAFEDAQWFGSGVTATADQTAAPDGTTTADKLTNTTAAGYMAEFGPAFTVTAGTVHTISVYAKAGTASWVKLQISDFSTSAFGCWFNISTGVLGTPDVGVGAVVDATSIEALANGWYRLVVSGHFISTKTGCGPAIAGVNADNSGVTTIGNFFYAWGIQVEAAAFASSYIPTTSAAASRAADVVGLIGALDAVLNGSAASVVTDIKYLGITLTYTFIGNTAGSQGIYEASNTTIASLAGGGTATFVCSVTWLGGGKVGFNWDAGAGSLVGGGGTVVSIPGAMGASYALRYDNGSPPPAYYRRLTAWTTRLADATLQGFTAP